MSLQDESFPADDLFDQLNNLSSGGARNTWFSEHHQPAAFKRDPAPFLEIVYADADFDADGDADVANKSAKTCVSDPVGRDQEDEDEDDDEDVDGDGRKLGGEKAPLGSGRSSKAVSYQDIHSAYTKRRFQHVTSKVSQYIAEIQAQDQKRRNAALTGIQRVNSMPESLTPNSQRAFDHDDAFKVHNCQTPTNANCNANSNNSSCNYERLLAENESLQQEIEVLKVEAKRLQTVNVFVQERLQRKMDDFLNVKRNFENLRNELSDCQQKLRRQQGYSQQSLNYIQPATIAKATQTDTLVAAISASGNGLVTPHPLGNLTYNSSKGSIEMALLSVMPSARVAQNAGHSQRVIHPQSLDFSSVSTEADGSGSGEPRVDSSSRPLVRRTPAPNNSETSQPSSNDSAIEVEGHEDERPSSRRQWRHQEERTSSQQWGHQHERMYYFDKRNNRVIEVMGFNISQGRNQSQDTIHNQSISDSQAHLLVHSMSQSQVETHVHFRSKRTTLGSRVLRFLGPCVRCRNGSNGDPMNGSNATYTVALPPMTEEEFIDPRNQR
ncbi:protein swallow [Drosophila teissieri]|uniref:protein swallow n=1 Tax=Drosophila teissieri TaxID=7243 RepID=UPI001CB9F10A|nr:protein swallow [Drosophila teissieri]